MRSYPMEVVGYTRGRGHLTLTLDGYLISSTGVAVIAALLSVRTIAAVHHRKINAECQNPFIFVIVINS